MRVRDWFIVAGSVTGVFVVAALVIAQLVTVGVDESYSPGIHSTSAAEARHRGVLLSTVRAEGPEFALGDARYRVTDAWIEDRVQTRYRFFLVPHDSLLNTPSLVVRIEALTPEKQALCVALGSRGLTYDGWHRFDGNDCGRWLASVALPYPTSVAVSVAADGLR
jgi:hypothetical protein